VTHTTALAEPQIRETEAVRADIVRMSGVSFAWPGRNPFDLVIENFALKRGERLFLVGPSGSGKSAFLSLLAGIVTPQVGVIDVLGADIARLSGAALVMVSHDESLSSRFTRVVNLTDIAKTARWG
jgi:ABC-type lipoprotein export system ATPase subunit